MRRETRPTRSSLADASCLVAFAFIVSAPYLARLGLYSDSWGLLADFHSAGAHGHSVIGEALSSVRARPVQWLYYALAYEAFGLRPLGYHLLATALVAAALVLLYLLLPRLGISRARSFAASLILLLLPQLSTIRVWFPASQGSLSLVFALLSMHAQLSFARSRRLHWLAAAVVAAILSAATYEIFGPLIAGFAGGLAIVELRRKRDRAISRRSWAPALVIIAAIAGAALWKLLVSDRAGPVGDFHHYLHGAYKFVRVDYDRRVDSGLNLFAAVFVHFVAPVRDWGRAGAALLTGGAALPVVIAAVAVAALTWWRASAPDPQALAKAEAHRLLILGIIAFLLGNAIFLVVPAVVFAPAGIANRTLVAAAIGVAIIFAGILALAVGALPASWRRLAFSLLLTIIAFAGVARIALVDRYWAQAADSQQRVLQAAVMDLRPLPSGATVILDGVCPYRGPGIVFESYWGVAGALSLTLHKEITGTVVSRRMWIGGDGIHSSVYGEPVFFPYGPTLYIYHPGLHLVVPVPDIAAARGYFSRQDRVTKCPRGFVGHGVPIG